MLWDRVSQLWILGHLEAGVRRFLGFGSRGPHLKRHSPISFRHRALVVDVGCGGVDFNFEVDNQAD